MYTTLFNKPLRCCHVERCNVLTKLFASANVTLRILDNSRRAFVGWTILTAVWLQMHQSNVMTCGIHSSRLWSVDETYCILLKVTLITLISLSLKYNAKIQQIKISLDKCVTYFNLPLF